MKTKIKTCVRQKDCHAKANQRGGFSLLEVMIACVVFFIGTFTILALVSSSLENARRLQRPMVDAGLLASELSLTNQLVEGETSGDFGDLYPGYNWTGKAQEDQTNKLFRVDYQVFNGNKVLVSKMSVLFFLPQSPAGSLDGATTAQ
jgi:type II secretory pathway pseudopilin PulG